LTHGVGALLSAAGLATMVAVAAVQAGPRAVVGCAIFGTTLVLAYLASTLYHAVASPRAKRVLRVLDHAAIYLLIAGTYTPLMLVSLRGGLGWALLGTVWVLAAVGIVLSAVALQRCKVVSMVLYLGMGWLVVVAARSLVAALSQAGLALVVAGGVAYTFVLVFYGWKRLPFNHAIWHLHVLAGSVLHFLAVLIEVRGG
jgi:hemolysin III